VHDELLDLVLNLSSEESFLGRFWGVVKSLRSQVMAVLAGHKSDEKRFNLINDQDTLGLISELHKGL
jgi:hypothetical protein